MQPPFDAFISSGFAERLAVSKRRLNQHLDPLDRGVSRMEHDGQICQDA